MSTFIETGHAKNVANFQSLISFATGYGAAYSPSKNALKLPQLNTLYTASQAALADIISKNTVFNNAVNGRRDTFGVLKSLSTRIINALQVTDATEEKIKDAKGYNRKIQGKRVSSSKVLPVDPDTPAPASISASQQSYDQLIQHFSALIAVVQSESTYTPNENDLKLTGLNAKLVDLQAKNTAVANAYTSVSNARIARDKMLYKEPAGLVPVAMDVKQYIKSVFGSASPEYAQVKALQFKKQKSVV